MAHPKFFRFLIAFMILGTLEVACCVIDTCGCGTSEGTTRYRITKYELATMAGASRVSVTRQSVLISDLHFVITPLSEIITYQLPSFRPLYACSPLDPTPTQNVLSFDIISDADFSLPTGAIAAGQPLNSLFLLKNGANGQGELSTFLLASNPDASMEDYVLTINKPVTEKQTHQFTIKVGLSDGQTFTLATLPIDLLP